MSSMRPAQSALLVMLALLALPATSGAKAGVSEIHELVATFEIVPNLEGEFKDVAVSLEVTVQPPVNPMGLGDEAVFAFRGRIGNDPIRNATVSLPDGRPTHFSVGHSDQGWRIEWRFRMVELSPITAVVRFTVVGAVRGNLKQNHIDFAWIDDWCNRGSKLTLRFMLPEEVQLTELEMEPAGFERIDYQGRPATQATWAQAKQRAFAAHFSPGVVNGKLYVSDEESWILVGSLAGIGLGLAAGMTLVWRLTARRRR